jgi:hypothetical protein
MDLGPRKRLSQVLIVGAVVLLVAILVGLGMGNHVLSQVAGREPVVPTPVPIPTAKPGERSSTGSLWKRIQIMAVATDPAFPDPRVTPEPEYRATAKPTPKRTPSPGPTRNPEYTSPPMPFPLVSHGPESPMPDPEATGAVGEVRRTPRPAPSVQTTFIP